MSEDYKIMRLKIMSLEKIYRSRLQARRSCEAYLCRADIEGVGKCTMG